MEESDAKSKVSVKRNSSGSMWSWFLSFFGWPVNTTLQRSSSADIDVGERKVLKRGPPSTSTTGEPPVKRKKLRSPSMKFRIAQAIAKVSTSSEESVDDEDEASTSNATDKSAILKRASNVTTVTSLTEQSRENDDDEEDEKESAVNLHAIVTTSKRGPNKDKSGKVPQPSSQGSTSSEF